MFNLYLIYKQKVSEKTKVKIWKSLKFLKDILFFIPNMIDKKSSNKNGFIKV